MTQDAKFHFFPTSHFEGRLDKIKQNDPPGYKRIQKVIERILTEPADADGRMTGLHHGRLKKYVGRREYRLIYHWCEACAKLSAKEVNKCGKCEDIHDHSVVFFDVYHKNELARMKHHM